ncbi:MAG: adenine phosphoribosyltransferase [Verrucomicrobiia bacterium]|jgi:adenine phosphoribosyltransferase
MNDQLKAAVRDVPDFPIKGVLFKDITPILQDGKLFRQAVDAIADRHKGRKMDAVVGIDARGFIFAGAVAYKLGIGLVPVRKKGKLPYKTVVTSYTLEYGSETSEMHVDALKKGDNVIIVDDLLATGGTAMAAATLVKQLGGNIIEIDFLIELSFLKGRERLKDYRVFSTIVY